MRCASVVAVALAAIGHVVAQSSSINQATFNNIIQYTRFARASYTGSCATPPNGSVVLNYFNDASTDAHGTLFRWDAQKQIIVTFRGTQSPQNWNSDLDFPSTALNAAGTSCSNCKVHEGFQKLYSALASQVIPAVKAAVAANPGYTVNVVGHSLGGALASIATTSLGGSGIKITTVYTYGEPRNGDSNFNNYLYTFVPLANYYRVTHANDAVPALPPSFLGFTHHGNEYWQKATGYNNTVGTTVKCPPPLLGGENTSCNLGQQSNTPVNHAHVTYSNDVTGNVLHIHDCGAPYP